ncbi:MAG: hypothetical protein ACK4UQ_06515 [Brevundimonas sp.]
MNDRNNRACDNAIAAIDRVTLNIDPATGHSTGWTKSDQTAFIVTERFDIHDAQRFDRDAVKAMLVDAINDAANYGGGAALDGLDNLWIGNVHSIDADVLTDTVIRWFDGPPQAVCSSDRRG